jgi:hypothetical protein
MLQFNHSLDRFNVIGLNNALYHTDISDTAIELCLLHIVVWCGVVWCGVVWCGVVWCDVM